MEPKEVIAMWLMTEFTVGANTTDGLVIFRPFLSGDPNAMPRPVVAGPHVAMSPAQASHLAALLEQCAQQLHSAAGSSGSKH